MLGSLGDQSDQFAKAVDSLSELVQGLEDRKDRHQQRGGLHQRRRRHASPTCWSQARPPFAKTVHETDRAAGIVVADHDYFDNLLNTLPDAYQVLARQGLYGDFFSFYLCDLRSQAQRQGRPAGVRQSRRPDHGEVRAEMKPFAERNPFVIGAIGLGADRRSSCWSRLNYDKMPFFNQGNDYSAYFAEAGGLTTGARRAGFGFHGGRGVVASSWTGRGCWSSSPSTRTSGSGTAPRRRSRPRACWAPRSSRSHRAATASQDGTIPLERTTSPYQLPDALGDLATTISGLNTNQLSDSLTGAGGDLLRHPARAEDRGGGRGAVLRHPQQPRRAAAQPARPTPTRSTAVLAERSDQVVSLVANTNALLAELRKPKRRAGSDLGQHLRAEPAAAGLHRRQPRHN